MGHDKHSCAREWLSRLMFVGSMAYVSFLLLVLFELVIDASIQGAPLRVNSPVWRGIKMSDEDVKGVALAFICGASWLL